MVQNDPLIEVSPFHIGLTASPILGIALISWYLDLGLESPILVGVVRACVQLSILSFILDPIFSWGVSLCWVVIVYVLFMIVLAAFESSTRSLYYFDGMFWCVLCILLANVAWVSLFAFAIILQPTPIWDPQYVIPIVGMLLGNCINGISLSMNAMLTSMVESSREIELLLSFGATSYEASFRLLKEAARTGTLPQLNGMAIIGVISIPGMMTGQILGGSSVFDAARYQILIIYLIAACSFSTIYMQLFFVLQICFDSRMILRIDRLKKRQVKPNAVTLIKSLWNASTNVRYQNSHSRQDHPRNLLSSSSSTFPSTVEESRCLSPNGELSVKIASKDNDQADQADQVSIDVLQLTFSFETKSDEERLERQMQPSTDENAGSQSRRTLFQDLSFQLAPGGSAIVQGPSGVGKSTLLRLLAGLATPDDGIIKLFGERISTCHDMTVWRRQILYVPQTKVEIPGTPLDLLIKICSFAVRTNDLSGTQTQMKQTVLHLLTDWGVNKSLLDFEWKTLSGGESQKLLLAVAIASGPKVILLDESTSAMDLLPKMRIEKSVKEYSAESGMSSIWITHDQVQNERINN